MYADGFQQHLADTQTSDVRLCGLKEQAQRLLCKAMALVDAGWLKCNERWH